MSKRGFHTERALRDVEITFVRLRRLCGSSLPFYPGEARMTNVAVHLEAQQIAQPTTDALHQYHAHKAAASDQALSRGRMVVVSALSISSTTLAPAISDGRCPLFIVEGVDRRCLHTWLERLPCLCDPAAPVWCWYCGDHVSNPTTASPPGVFRANASSIGLQKRTAMTTTSCLPN